LNRAFLPWEECAQRFDARALRLVAREQRSEPREHRFEAALLPWKDHELRLEPRKLRFEARALTVE
jgi:hypothetical protein